VTGMLMIEKFERKKIKFL